MISCQLHQGLEVRNRCSVQARHSSLGGPPEWRQQRTRPARPNSIDVSIDLRPGLERLGLGRGGPSKNRQHGSHGHRHKPAPSEWPHQFVRIPHSFVPQQMSETGLRAIRGTDNLVCIRELQGTGNGILISARMPRAGTGLMLDTNGNWVRWTPSVSASSKWCRFRPSMMRPFISISVECSYRHFHGGVVGLFGEYFGCNGREHNRPQSPHDDHDHDARVRVRNGKSRR